MTVLSLQRTKTVLGKIYRIGFRKRCNSLLHKYPSDLTHVSWVMKHAPLYPFGSGTAGEL